MCVIFVSEKTRPEADDMARAATANKDGIGITWVHPETKLVHWRKGLKLETAQNLVKVVPFPFAVHFRLATIGGTSPQLTHPFPIEDGVSLKLKGKSSVGVLMHNGHWATWRNWLTRREEKRGPWSDSRALAYLVRRIGTVNLLREIGGKFAIATPDGITTIGDFTVVKPGFVASNMFWKWEPQTYVHRSHKGNSMADHWYQEYMSAREADDELNPLDQKALVEYLNGQTRTGT